MKQLTLYCFSAFALCLSACGQNTRPQTQIEIPENWSVLSESDFSIHYPDSFELDTSGQLGLNFILFSNPTSEKDLFLENINLVVQDLTGNSMNLDQFVEVSEEQIRNYFIGGNIVNSERTNENSKRERHRIVFTGKQEQFDLKFLQYYWIANGKAYILTLTAEANQFEKYLPVSEQVMNTFEIH